MHDIQSFQKAFFNEINNISDINTECVDLIAKEIKYETYNCLQFYSHVNEFSKKISFVCEGVLRIFHLDENGNEWNKHFLTENDFFAASSNPKIRSNTAIQALTPAKVISIPIDRFLVLSSQYKLIDNFIHKLLSLVVEKEKERGLMLMSLSASKKYEYFNKTFPNLENRIQHYHIASYLGITPTQLSRIRNK